MTIERLNSKKIEDKKTLLKNIYTTHIRVEEENLVQYRCNPHPGYSMSKVPSDITEFIPNEKRVDGRVFSRVISALGGEGPITFHYQA